MQSVSNYQWHFSQNKNLKTLEFVRKFKKAPNTHSNFQKEKWNWRKQDPGLQAILQSYSHQNMLLASKQRYRSMEQDIKPINKPTHLLPINLQQRKEGYKMEERQSPK